MMIVNVVLWLKKEGAVSKVDDTTPSQTGCLQRPDVL